MSQSEWSSSELEHEIWEWDGIGWVERIDDYVDRLNEDHRFAIEVAAAKAWGVKFSKFLRWDIEDRAIAIADLLRDAREREETCPDCGTKPGAWKDEHGRSVTPLPYTYEWESCGGCEMRAVALAEHHESWQRPKLKRASAD